MCARSWAFDVRAIGRHGAKSSARLHNAKSSRYFQQGSDFLPVSVSGMLLPSAKQPWQHTRHTAPGRCSARLCFALTHTVRDTECRRQNASEETNLA
jgi:hypothetical protein